MEKEQAFSVEKQIRTPWNKGKLIGAKPPLRPSHVWSIRTKLQMQGKTRESLCSILPSIVSFEAVTLLPSASMTWHPAVTRWTGKPFGKKKTGRPVRFELTDQTRQAIDQYL